MAACTFPIGGAFRLPPRSSNERMSVIQTPPLSVAMPSAGAGASREEPEPVTIIEPSRGAALVDAGELRRYRELLYFLVWRDIQVRYKQTVLGGAWAVLQPLATMVVFSLFLGRAARALEPGVAYPLFIFAGLLPWMFLANSVNAAAGCLVGNQNLITKVYFPRLFVPIATISSFLVDFIVSFFMLVALMIGFWVWPGMSLFAAPLLVLLLIGLTLGMALWLSALTVRYRDFRHIVPFMVQLWMFSTPAIYLPNEGMAGPWLVWLLPLNPAQGIVHNFRASMLGGSIEVYSLGMALVVSLATLMSGLVYFRRVERTFADVI